jgi:hypothetical protein
MPAGWQEICADYIFVMHFNGETIGYMTKIWNAGMPMHSLETS